MIICNIAELRCFLNTEGWTAIRNVLSDPDKYGEEGEYELLGEELFVKRIKYRTTPTNNYMVEAHRRYVDVQVLLDGTERIEVYNREQLEIKNPYSEQSDCAFFIPSEQALFSNIILRGGLAAILFSNDAHLAALNYGKESMSVDKLVFKVYEKFFK